MMQLVMLSLYAASYRSYSMLPVQAAMEERLLMLESRLVASERAAAESQRALDMQHQRMAAMQVCTRGVGGVELEGSGLLLSYQGRQACRMLFMEGSAVQSINKSTTLVDCRNRHTLTSQPQCCDARPVQVQADMGRSASEVADVRVFMESRVAAAERAATDAQHALDMQNQRVAAMQVWARGVRNKCGRGVWENVWERCGKGMWVHRGVGKGRPLVWGEGVGQCWPGVGSGCARDAAGPNAVVDNVVGA